MKKIFIAGLIVLGFMAVTASAQDWYHDREGRFQGEGWRMHLFEHVRADIEHVQETSPWKAQREARRLERTKQELRDLQGKLESHGNFDGRELQDVIDSLVKSSNDQRLSPQDKNILNDDLNRLRDYRDHHEHWGEHR